MGADMNRVDLVDRLRKILRSYAGRNGFWDSDDAWIPIEIDIDADALLDELDREGLEIVKK